VGRSHWEADGGRGPRAGPTTKTTATAVRAEAAFLRGGARWRPSHSHPGPPAPRGAGRPARGRLAAGTVFGGWRAAEAEARDASGRRPCSAAGGAERFCQPRAALLRARGAPSFPDAPRPAIAAAIEAGARRAAGRRGRAGEPAHDSRRALNASGRRFRGLGEGFARGRREVPARAVKMCGGGGSLDSELQSAYREPGGDNLTPGPGAPTRPPQRHAPIGRDDTRRESRGAARGAASAEDLARAASSRPTSRFDTGDWRRTRRQCSRRARFTTEHHVR